MDELFTGERAMPLAPNMDPAVMQEHWARYRFALPYVKGKRVLDAACGAGYGAERLAREAAFVVGVDISPQAIAYSRKHYARANVSFQVMDIHQLAFHEGSFEVVVSFETLEHIADGDAFLREVSRVLEPNGTLIVSTPLGGPVGNPFHNAFYQRRMFKGFLEGFFSHVEVYYQRGTEFSPTSASPPFARRFTGEYAVAVYRGPKKSIPGLTSIVILTHNGLSHTRSCVESIRAHTHKPYELIFVDNGSNDGTVQFLDRLAKEDESIRLISNASNYGFPRGNNQGLKIARGEYMLLLNNDTIATEGWLGRMLAVFQRHPEVGLVGPMSNYVSGPQLIPDVPYRTLAGMEVFAARWAAEHAGKSVPATRLVGFCLMVRRAVIDHIGGLDERFGSGNFEDDDFCIRAAIAGFKARIAQDVFIHHTGGQTFKGAGIDYHRSMEGNWELFKEKWMLLATLTLEEGYPFRRLTRREFDIGRDFIPLGNANGEPRVSVIAWQQNQPDDEVALGGWLEHLHSSTREPLEVMVTDSSPAFLINSKLAEKEGGYIVLLSTDVSCPRGWLERLIEQADVEGTIAMVGPCAQEAPLPQRPVPGSPALAKPQGISEARASRRQGKQAEVPYLGGFCLLFRVASCRRVGSIDEDLEFPLALWNYQSQAREIGHKLICARDVVVDHQRLKESEGACYDGLARAEERILDLVARGNEHLEKGEREKAVEVFELCVEEFPQFVGGYVALANLAAEEGELEEATGLLELALALEPGSTALMNGLGCLLFRTGQTSRAEALFREALRQEPENLDSLSNLGQLLAAEGKYAEAIQHLNPALARNPDDVEVLLALGNCAFQLGAGDVALEAYRRALTLAPEYPRLEEMVSTLQVAGQFGGD